MPKSLQAPDGHLLRRAELRPGTFDREARTVEVVLSRGGARMVTIPGIGRVRERLEISEAAVDLNRLRTAGPVLDSHGLDRPGPPTTRDQLGSVQDAWLERDGEEMVLVARLHFRRTAAGEEAMQGVEDGDVRSVSAGYRVLEYREETQPGDKVRSVVAVRWEPWEATFTPLPAEATAGVRSAELTGDRDPNFNDDGHEATPMDEENPNGGGGEAPAAGEQTPTQTRSDQTDAGGAPPVTPPAPEPVATRTADEDATLLRRGGELERQRIQQIDDLATRFGLAGEELVTRMVNDGVPVADARVQMLEHLATQTEPLRRSGALSVGETEGTKMARSVEIALEHRLGLAEGEIEDDGARALRFRSLLDQGRELLTRHGIQVRQDPSGAALDILSYRSAHSSSDFGGVLANVANKALRRAYGMTPQRWKAFGRAGEVPDFKEARRVQLGAIGNMVKKPEGGGITYKSMVDAFERVRAETYSLGFSITREAMVNDDLGAFSRIVPHMAAAASRTIDTAAFALLEANPVMEDGTALFDAAHGNVVTTAPLTVAGFQKAYEALRAQTGLGGADDILDLMPHGVLVPTALTGTAHQLLVETVVADSVANVNPWGKMIAKEMVLDSPRLTSSDFWFLMADQALIDILEVSFLQGREMPQIEQEFNFQTKDRDFSMIHDWGMAFLDHRGIVRAKVTA